MKEWYAIKGMYAIKKKWKEIKMDSIKCSVCGHPVSEGERVCANCIGELCGNEIEENLMVCDGCKMVYTQ